MPNVALGATPQLILASASRYRAELLDRLRLAFTAEAANIDETQLMGEDPQRLVERLSNEKAAALRPRWPQAWILGSDQVAVIDSRIVGKPGSRAKAIAQLRTASGREVQFLTGVTLSTPRGDNYALDVTRARFMSLSDAQIERYIDVEPAFDCAGSFKCEGYGISLFESIDSSDPTALIGLPLISVCRLLRAAGYPLP